MRVRRFLARYLSTPRMDYAVHWRVAGTICCGVSRGISTPHLSNVTCPACRQAIPEEKR